jgi:glutathione S-transferase
MGSRVHLGAQEPRPNEHPMSIIFYHSPMSSAAPVAWALAELGTPHERIHVNLGAGDQRKPDFLALNPNGKVPTLVIDGAPMFEALAIMLYLGDRFGVEKGLWPALDDARRPPAMAWSVWSYVSFGTSLRQLFYAQSERLGPEYQNKSQADHARKELGSLLSLLDAHLAKQPWVLGGSFSLADLIPAAVIGFAETTGVEVKPHERVNEWLRRCQARPTFRAAEG